MRFRPLDFAQYRSRLAVNPIIVKELRSRMRGARAFIILTGVLLLLGAVSYALYRIVLATSRYTTSPLSPQVGQTLFGGLAFLELMMVCFITPAVTSGAISSEQEKMTFEMLLATPLRPTSILLGKLVSSLSYVLLLIFAAVPMASLVFIFGGVAVRDMVKALVILMAVTVMLGVLGMFISAWLGRTGRATVLSYLVVLALLVGPVFVYILVAVLQQREPPRWILIPNPASALFSALSSTTSLNEMGPASILWILGMGLSGNLWGLIDQPGQFGIPRPLYHYTLPLYGLMTLGLYLLATRLVRPTRRWRIGWKAALAALLLFLLFGSAVALAFFSTADRYEKVSILATPTPFPMPAPVIVESEVVQVRPLQPTMVPPPVATEAPLSVSPLPTPTPEALPPFGEEDEVAIYAAVVRQLYTVDHTFGEPPNFSFVFLVQATDDSVGDPDAPRAGSQVLRESVRKGVVKALSDLPAEFGWISERGEAPLNEDFSVVDGGAVFTLGNIHAQPGDSALVSASLYIGPEGALGKTYVLERVDGVWQVMGDTGVRWIS
jgi:ABC-2 type transport system permease protein